MLQSVSWATFIKALILTYCMYYAVLSIFLYHKKIWDFIRQKLLLPVLSIVLVWPTLRAQTADGGAGLTKANTMIRGYFDEATQILYAVGAIIALIGAGSVYSHWNEHSRQDLAKEAAGWFAGCIFLVVVATVIKSFFGL